MKIKTQLLSDLTVSAGQGAILSGGELEPEIPPVIQPIIEIPMVLPHFGSLSSSTPLTQSAIISDLRFKPANTATTVDPIITLGLGLWDIFIHLNYSSSVAKVPTSIAPCFFMDFLDPASGAPVMFASGAQAGLEYRRDFHFLLHLRTSPWTFRMGTPATGAGETLFYTSTSYAKRLL